MSIEKIQDLIDHIPKIHPLKELFYRHRISQELLARVAGTTQRYIFLFLNGYRDLHPDQKGKLTDLARRLEDQEFRGIFNNGI